MRSMLGAVLSVALVVVSTIVAEPLPVETFLAPPEFRLPKLSPDGRLYGNVEVAQDLEFITVVDLATRQPKRAAIFKDLKVVNYWWKSSGAILVLVEDLKGNRDWRSFDLKTNETHYLYTFNSLGSTLVNPLVDDPDNILVSAEIGSEVDLRRVNIRTGKSVIVQPNGDLVQRWLTNRAGRAIAGFGRHDLKWFISFPEKPGQSWRRVLLGEKNLPDFWPVSVAPDQRRILGIDYTSGDTNRIVAWDPATDTKEIVWQTPEVDLNQLLVWGDDTSFTRGIVYETDRPRVHYLEPADLALAKMLDATLPNTFNAIVSTSADESKMIIESYSDVLPEWYYLLDRKTGLLAQLGSAHPKIDSARMAPSRYFTFKTRDGLELHGRIYLPRETKMPLPTLLILAGDSFVERTHFGYEPYLQFLASRGYAVVEIDHRGVNGYGNKLHEAGTLQIAGAIANDLADGLRWLVGEGLVDGDRIGIQGILNAGIIAVPALIRHPDLFKVWANFATPLSASKLKFSDVVFGRYTEEETIARAGGYSAGRKYIHSLDLAPLIASVHVPSFHFYPRDATDGIVADYGTSTEHYLKATGQPYELLKGRLVRNMAEYFENREQKDREDAARTFTELAAFLDKYLALRK